ncbi:M20/M25/M40 family metallo-hydrolase [Flavobacterium sp. CYK-55]|uniref:M20/M25/M40 family metallo-hydrolase n=1 Tax=Flavobacterium sp. CYK-55 TaxID=2835529 RepID=UPI001BD0EEF3|nr:M20/M25/M40 family metallo-hydrolase [Flavobacterium sp. CYK-55]MBS7787605.1 M20/M25/M40 family metallo-hydrolase [Flavobacterium sp. CYK-55]
MKKNRASLWASLWIGLVLAVLYLTLMPRWVSSSTNLNEFSTAKALEHINVIAQKPHFVGSQNHEVVAQYLIGELKKLGLKPEVQQGTTLTEWGNLVRSKNILARIPGKDSSKALLLLSHYDSAPHSYSLGACDDASGVATILEGLRAFLNQKTSHKNDIIILFSDAEELGLNGAALFVTQHKWAKEVGLAINFEARGSSGPSYMLMEVNRGNTALVDGFIQSNPSYPVTNSLMYSIYKMLPNDTDLTVFREQGKIQGFNFAYIDNHFNYHTAQDSFENVSPETIAHQGSYLMPLLHHLSNADLGKLNSNSDSVYFNTPAGLFSYPFSWNVPLAIGGLVFLAVLIFIGLGKRILTGREIGKGFLKFTLLVILVGLINYLGWQLLLKVYPQYQEIQQGFPYNGHLYMAAFSFLSLAVAFLIYFRTQSVGQHLNQSIAPLTFWVFINMALALYLPGASFLIFPTFFGLIMLAYFIISQRTNTIINALFSVPILWILAPLITQLPIGLGLKIMAGSSVLLMLTFGLLLPLLAVYQKKVVWSAIFFIFAIGFMGWAHTQSDFHRGKTKPNSLVYWQDHEKHQSFWGTYDKNLDPWTQTYLGQNPTKANELNAQHMFSKYDAAFTFSAPAPKKNIPGPTIEFLKDSTANNRRYLQIKISPNRKVHRYDIFAPEKIQIHHLRANGVNRTGEKGSFYERNSTRILSYYVVNNQPLELSFDVAAHEVLNMNLLESSFNLLYHPDFNLKKRADWMMPKPFVLTDAVIIHQKIKPTAQQPATKITLPLPPKTTQVLLKNVRDTTATLR